ncbi:hypothetical protein JW824_13515 [bacterium]|nr:hypothetical protein [bacterium]
MVRWNIVFIVFALMLTMTQVGFCQNLYLSLNGGLSKDMRFSTENEWKMGFSFGGNVLFNSPGMVAFGLHFSYNHWSIDGKGWERFLFSGYRVDRASGTQNIIEIIPSVRVLFLGKNPALKLYLHGGIGFFLVNISDAKISGSYNSTYETGWMETTIEAKNSANVGAQIGPCLILGNRLELLPIYSLYLMDGDLYNHISVQLGISIL